MESSLPGRLGNMMDLGRVCHTLLDNADVDVGLDSRTATATLDFTVGGSLERVIFRCSRLWRFRYAKAGEDADGLFVGETQVAVIEGGEAVWAVLKEDWQGTEEVGLPQRLFHVRTEGQATLDIVCEGFEWELHPAS
jgi:hypothetical protein